MADEDTVEGRDFTVEDTDTSAYHGVSHEYATYATDTEAPLATDEELELYDQLAEKQTAGDAVNPGTLYKGDEEKKPAKKTSSSRTSSSPAPASPSLTSPTTQQPPPPPPVAEGGTKEGNTGTGDSK